MAESIDKGRIGSEDSILCQGITIGEVVDTNDPQQMGRVRVLCHAMGDNPNAAMKDIPWATAMSPLGGVTTTTSRGREGEKSLGPIAYGMWNVPKVGSHVLIACLDGDPQFRIWLGCIHPQFLTHTLPHGRYISNKSNSIKGPFTSSEDPIEPTQTHQTNSFTPQVASDIVPGAPAPGSDHTAAPEFMTRGADFAAAAVRDEFVPFAETGVISIGDDNSEDIVTDVDGTVHNHHNGYKSSRVVSGIGYATTDGKNYDPQVYSWTTPGFHSVSMDDSAGNCRIRMRTTHGNQIILDDTNERIYLSTPDGKTWIEMDEQGNIDVYAKRNISFHAEKDINFTAGDTFRVKAKNGIHLESDDELRIHSKGELGGDLHVRSETNIRQHAALNTFIETDLLTHIKSGLDIMVQTGTILNITAATHISVTTPETSISNKVKIGDTLDVVTATTIGTTLDVGAGTRIGATLDVVGATTVATIIANDSSIANPPGGGDHGGQVKLGNGGTPAAPVPPMIPIPAIPAIPAEEFQAFWTSRVPEHEPWARVMTNPGMTDLIIGNTHTGAAEFPYNSPNVGRMERGDALTRNAKWHR